MAAGMLALLGACGADDALAPESGEPAATALAQTGSVRVIDPADCDEIYHFKAYNPNDPSQPFTVPAGSELNQNLTFTPPWGDEVVQAVAFIPQTDNRKVVHHWGAYVDDIYLMGWAPGGEDRPFLPKDVGIELPKGAKAVKLNLHYYNRQGTEAALDRTGVDFCVVKQGRLRPKSAAVFTSFGSIGVGKERLMAPAGAKDYAVTSTCVIEGTQQVNLLSVSPHAHEYAVHMKLTRTRGTEELVLHDGPFQFSEQRGYLLPGGGEVDLKPGDVVTTQCIYSNPTTKNVYFGESTGSEMCFIMAAYYPKGGFTCKGGGLFGSSGGPLRSPTDSDHEIPMAR